MQMMRARNLCNHRDFQNIGVNGGCLPFWSFVCCQPVSVRRVPRSNPGWLTIFLLFFFVVLQAAARTTWPRPTASFRPSRRATVRAFSLCVDTSLFVRVASSCCATYSVWAVLRAFCSRAIAACRAGSASHSRTHPAIVTHSPVSGVACSCTRAVTDQPATVFYALIGNDVCSHHHGVRIGLSFLQSHSVRKLVSTACLAGPDWCCALRGARGVGALPLRLFSCPLPLSLSE